MSENENQARTMDDAGRCFDCKRKALNYVRQECPECGRRLPVCVDCYAVGLDFYCDDEGCKQRARERCRRKSVGSIPKARVLFEEMDKFLGRRPPPGAEKKTIERLEYFHRMCDPMMVDTLSNCSCADLDATLEAIRDDSFLAWLRETGRWPCDPETQDEDKAFPGGWCMSEEDEFEWYYWLSWIEKIKRLYRYWKVPAEGGSSNVPDRPS